MAEYVQTTAVSSSSLAATTAENTLIEKWACDALNYRHASLHNKSYLVHNTMYDKWKRLLNLIASETSIYIPMHKNDRD